MRRKRSWVLALAALSLASVLAGCGENDHVGELRHIENHQTGLTLMIPHGWRVWHNSPFGASSVMLSTYPIARLGDITETPPQVETWLLLYDDGPLWNSPGHSPGWAKQFRPLPRRLPPEAGIEGFGSGRNLVFGAGGHAFQAFIKGNPANATTLAVLRSIRFTRYGRTLALAITKRAIEGIPAWRVGNPRSEYRLIVVGCPHRADCGPGVIVTERLLHGIEPPLAADLWVIPLLYGREDVLARLQRRLRPEATLQLGNIRDPDLWTRRIVALAR